jgi:type II secretory pathway pseudopilin PulG
MASRSRTGAFTLTEILVAAMLLAGSLVAVMTLWSVSRRITERTRSTAEAYDVARQEAERYRAFQFNGIFNSTTFVAGTPRYTDYDETGARLAMVASKDSPVTISPNRAYYRTESAFYLEPTSADDPLQRIGVQVIRVYPITYSNGEGRPPARDDTDVYHTMQFLSIAGV